MNFEPSVIDLLVLAATIVFAYAGYLFFGASQGLTSAIMRLRTWRTWHLAWAVPLNVVLYVLAITLMLSPFFVLAQIIW